MAKKQTILLGMCHRSHISFFVFKNLRSLRSCSAFDFTDGLYRKDGVTASCVSVLQPCQFIHADCRLI